MFSIVERRWIGLCQGSEWRLRQGTAHHLQALPARSDVAWEVVQQQQPQPRGRPVWPHAQRWWSPADGLCAAPWAFDGA